MNELAGKTYQGTVTEYRDGKPTGEQFVFKVQFDSEGDYLTISGLIGPRHPYPVEFSNAAWFTSDKHHVSISNSSIGDPIQLDIIMGFSVPATRLEITKIILSDKALSYSGSLDLIESE